MALWFVKLGDFTRTCGGASHDAGCSREECWKKKRMEESDADNDPRNQMPRPGRGSAIVGYRTIPKL